MRTCHCVADSTLGGAGGAATALGAAAGGAGGGFAELPLTTVTPPMTPAMAAALGLPSMTPSSMRADPALPLGDVVTTTSQLSWKK